MLIFNTILLLLTVAYGLAFGIKNIIYKLYCLFTKNYFKISDLGRFLDWLFIISICYFYYIDVLKLLELIKQY